MKLYNRETSYYTIITIPKCLVSKYGKKQIWRSLNTKDYKLAKLRAELETMSIRRKLLNDLNKQKEKTSKALDFAQILDDDDDDFFEDDIDIKDTVDFSHYTEEEFAKLDDFYAMANMSHQTYEKFKEIKKRYRQQQKIQKALEKEKADNQIRSSIYDYDEQQAEDLAYNWLINKIEDEKDRLKTSKNLSDDKRLYRENLSFYETKYINNEYSIIDDEMNLYLFEDIYKSIISLSLQSSILDELKTQQDKIQYKINALKNRKLNKYLFDLYLYEHQFYEANGGDDTVLMGCWNKNLSFGDKLSSDEFVNSSQNDPKALAMMDNFAGDELVSLKRTLVLTVKPKRFRRSNLELTSKISEREKEIC